MPNYFFIRHIHIFIRDGTCRETAISPSLLFILKKEEVDLLLDKISGIYCIENKINNKKYIGKSVDIYERWSKHKTFLRNNKHDNTYLQHAWNKYGSENFDFYILEECDELVLNDKEKMYINKYNATNRDFGYNRTAGGTGGNTLCSYTNEQLIEHKLKMSNMLKEKSHKGEDAHNAKLTNQQVKLIIQMLLDGKHDDEIASKFNVSARTINDIRSHKNWKSFTINIDFPKISHRYFCRNEKIRQYDLNGNFIHQYDSLVELKKELGLNTSFISQVCRGVRCTAYGYVFRFNDDPFDKYDINRYAPITTPVDQYDLQGNFITTYQSVAEAQRAVGARIDYAVYYTDKPRTSAGFYWVKHGEVPLFLKKENENA